jgi:hypothetical protein
MQDSKWDVIGWAAQLPGKRIAQIARLLDDPDDRPADINRSFEPLLVDVGDEPVFLTLDEGKGNVLVYPYSLVQASRSKVFGGYYPVEIDSEALFGSPDFESFGLIRSVAVLSLADRDLADDYFSVCGLLISSEIGSTFAIGTHLTELRVLGLWLLPAKELSPEVGVHRL